MLYSYGNKDKFLKKIFTNKPNIHLKNQNVMKKIQLCFVVAVIMATTFFTGCVAPQLTSYSTSTRASYSLAPEDETKIQLYNDSDIVLERIVNEGDTTITGGILTENNGKKIHRVIIKTLTEGGVVAKNDSTIEVAFGKDENYWVSFTPGDDGDFALLVSTNENGNPSVQYGENSYEVISGEGTKLLFYLKKTERAKEISTHEKGRKVQ